MTAEEFEQLFGPVLNKKNDLFKDSEEYGLTYGKLTDWGFQLFSLVNSKKESLDDKDKQIITEFRADYKKLSGKEGFLTEEKFEDAFSKLPENIKSSAVEKPLEPESGEVNKEKPQMSDDEILDEIQQLDRVIPDEAEQKQEEKQPDEKEKAEEWYKGFLSGLEKQGYDLDDPMFTYCLYGLGNEASPLVHALKSPDAEALESEKFLYTCQGLRNLDENNKYLLYGQALSGQLFIHKPGEDMSKASVVFVKEDGSCDFDSPSVKDPGKIILDTQKQLEQDEPDLKKNDPEAFKRKLDEISGKAVLDAFPFKNAQNREGLLQLAKELTSSESVKKAASEELKPGNWQSAMLTDMVAHPNRYKDPDVLKQRVDAYIATFEIIDAEKRLIEGKRTELEQKKQQKEAERLEKEKREKDPNKSFSLDKEEAEEFLDVLNDEPEQPERKKEDTAPLKSSDFKAIEMEDFSGDKEEDAGGDLENEEREINALEQELAAKEKPVIMGLDMLEKTITDIYKGSGGEKENIDIDTLIETGFIRDKDGKPFKNEKHPWDGIEDVYRYLSTSEKEMNDNPVYLESPDGKFSYSLRYKMGVFSLQKNVSEIDPERFRLIGYEYKQNVIKELEDIQKSLAATGVTKKDSKSFLAMREACDSTINKLKKSVFKKDFTDTLDEFARTAEQYYFEKAGQSRNKRRSSRIACASRIKAIAKQAKKEIVPKVDVEKQLLRDIAANAVKSFALSNRESMDPAKYERANQILKNRKEFEKEIDRALKNPGFIAVFGGDPKHPVDRSFLSKSIMASGSDIVRTVAAKQRALSKEEIASIREANRREKTFRKPRRRITEKEGKEIQKQLQDLKKELDSIWGKGKSPEFDKLRHDLNVANIRVNNNGPGNYMYEMLAKLADTADNYYMKKLGEDPNWLGRDRLSVASKIRHLADTVNEGKLPSEAPMTDYERYKRDLGAKLVQQIGKNLIGDFDADRAAKGKAILSNPKVFNENVDKVINSKAFKKLFTTDKTKAEKILEDAQKLINDKDKIKPEQLELAEKNVIKAKANLQAAKEKDVELFKSYLKDDPQKLCDMLGSEEVLERREAVAQRLRQQAQLKKEQEKQLKDNKKKELEKEAVKKEEKESVKAM